MFETVSVEHADNLQHIVSIVKIWRKKTNKMASQVQNPTELVMNMILFNLGQNTYRVGDSRPIAP